MNACAAMVAATMLATCSAASAQVGAPVSLSYRDCKRTPECKAAMEDSDRSASSGTELREDGPFLSYCATFLKDRPRKAPFAAIPQPFPDFRLDMVTTPGTMIISLDTDERGRPQNIRMVSSQGSRKFDAIGMKTVGKLRLCPAYNDEGKPVPYTGHLVRYDWNYEVRR